MWQKKCLTRLNALKPISSLSVKLFQQQAKHLMHLNTLHALTRVKHFFCQNAANRSLEKLVKCPVRMRPKVKIFSMEIHE